jgi:hypothetical protein
MRLTTLSTVGNIAASNAILIGIAGKFNAPTPRLGSSPLETVSHITFFHLPHNKKATFLQVAFYNVL